jgi:KaiC/GvpD/RAD55 family RecA-like ATPase
MSDSYSLHPDFEQIVLYYAATSRRFWATIGSSLEHELMTNPLAKTILKSVELIVKDTGTHPGSLTIVLQRLQSYVTDGKLKQATLDEVCDLFDAWVDDAPDMEAVIQELVPVIRQRMHQVAILSATDDYSKKKDPVQAISIFEKAQRLGQAESSGDRYSIGAHTFAEIASASNISRQPTGIGALDLSLNGGLDRCGLGVFMAGPGGGKSICLNHGIGESMRNGLFVGGITLELPPRMFIARIMANLTGVETDLIYLNDAWRSEAEKRFASIQHLLGACTVAEFAPHASTVAQVVEWIEEEEQIHGRKMDAVYVDYADKLHAPSVRADNDYLAMRFVYESLRRDVAVARNMWVWTASQVSRSTKESSKRIDLNHVADSMHKVRVADLVITLNNDDISRTTTYFVAKNRTGRSRFDVGPLPTDHARGRASLLPSELGAW